MKLLKAKFQNFRMLRDLELDFSHDSTRKLTVIRAANESGKTTILHGLQWALYGDAALPAKGANFRLHPIDWRARDGKHAPITATVDFEITHYRLVSGKERKTSYHYRLIRSANEEIDSKYRREPSTVSLYRLTEKGTTPIHTPESIIQEELPPELREVFFTDGDRALSFIEADVQVSTKRARVQRAIHSLLGLEIVHAAIGHVKKSAAEVNKKAKQISDDGQLKKISSRLEELELQCENLQNDLQDANLQFTAYDQQCDMYEHEISVILQKGDKERLKSDLDQVHREIKDIDKKREAAKKIHSDLFKSRSIATNLLSSELSAAFTMLEKLRQQGKIPNTTIPVLRDCLKSNICICGETLKLGDQGAEKRRNHIQKRIVDSEEADDIQKIITELYYSTTEDRNEISANTSAWLSNYEDVSKERDQLFEKRQERGRKLRTLEQQLDSLPDVDIRGIRHMLKSCREQRDTWMRKQVEIKTQLEVLKKEYENLVLDRDRLLRQEKRGALLRAGLDVTGDALRVLENTHRQITHHELQKVSHLMNNIFLEMIGSDPEQGAIIRHAEISRKFDILVYGPKNRSLDPDRDLNGASRRALTLAFILALTKISEVEAPNVIDTPLGMTSGFVKQSILRTAVRESQQLILLLTHDEIAGCEEIIDQEAGVVYTLTNPAHYPVMLIHDPMMDERRVLRCACDHRNTCQLCHRRLHSDTTQ